MMYFLQFTDIECASAEKASERVSGVSDEWASEWVSGV